MFMYDFKFNLQLFAEGGDTQNDPSPDNPKDGPDNPKDNPDDGGQDVQAKINEAVKAALTKAKKIGKRKLRKRLKSRKDWSSSRQMRGLKKN